MESSQFLQRALITLSIVALGITATAWWLVSGNSPQRVDTLKNVSSQQPIDPAVVEDSSVVAVQGNVPEVNSEEDLSQYKSISSIPTRLAAYEQQPPESPIPNAPIALPVPGSGVQVPAASSTATRGRSIEYLGVLAFVNDVRVVAQADGVIREFLVDEGSLIEKDKIMVKVDDRLALAEQEVTRKELESARLKAEDDSQIRFAEAAEKVAAADYRRTEDLFKRDVANIDEFERKQLEWQKSRLSIDVSKREKRINQAAVGVSEAKFNASGVQLELRTIRAPFTGIVAKTERENFEWVKAGDEILRLVSLEKFRVRGRVILNDSPNILLNAPAKVHVQIKTGQVEIVDGIVGFVEPEASVAVDGKNEYGVWVEIENRFVDGQPLFRGKMNATVEIFPNR